MLALESQAFANVSITFSFSQIHCFSSGIKDQSSFFFLLSEFYGQTHLEAAFIDVILDTLVDMGDKAIPYLLEKDATKKVMNTCYNADKRFLSINPGSTSKILTCFHTHFSKPGLSIKYFLTSKKYYENKQIK